eukprot:TRINITY_DN5321_c0_g1_i2.p1 TRINITY_DN5321_c0_g1~~TRINITY_DN5321_c0_g1_i2.p1  ORF type:complete len:470 (-),score=124.80 TRINITY_DN5321_c0_g1_i2:35-1444(-)
MLLISVFQIGAVLPTLLNFDPPSPSTDASRVMELANLSFSLFQPECSLGDSIMLNYYLALLQPLFFIAVLLVFHAVCSPFALQVLSLLNVDLSSSTFSGSHPATIFFRFFLQGIILSLDIQYLTLSSKVFSVFDCSKQNDGYYYLASSPGMRCFSGDWYLFLPGCIAGFLVYVVGIPLGFSRIVKWLESGKETPDSHQQFFSQYCFLGRRLKGNHPYWQIGLMWWKAAFVSIRIFIPSTSLLRGVFAVLLMLTLLMFKIGVRPYTLRINNILDVFIHTCLLLVLLSAEILVTSSSKLFGADKRTVEAIYFIAWALAFLGLAYSIWLTVKGWSVFMAEKVKKTVARWQSTNQLPSQVVRPEDTAVVYAKPQALDVSSLGQQQDVPDTQEDLPEGFLPSIRLGSARHRNAPERRESDSEKQGTEMQTLGDAGDSTTPRRDSKAAQGAPSPASARLSFSPAHAADINPSHEA